MRAWANRFTVIAPDYPGFGMSDPFGADGELELSLADFAEVLIAFMDEIGVASASAYGFHTGAGMAVAMADFSPSHISAVYANGYVILQQQELDEILSGYLPRFEPHWDGSHLLWMWSRNHDQLVFYPWFDRRAEARIKRTVPSPEVLQQWAMEFLRAGDHYRVGYRAAFSFPGDVPLRTLQSPAIITATKTDVLSGYLSRVTEPSAQVQVRVGGTMEENLAEAAEFFLQHPGSDVAPVSDTRSVKGCAWNFTVQYPHGYIRVRADMAPQGTPVLIVHGAGGSCETVEPWLQAFRSNRPVVALDLPGHGETDGLPDNIGFLDACEAAIAAVLDKLQIEQVDGWGQWGGATVLAAAASRQPQRFRKLALSGVQCLEAGQAKELAANFAPRIETHWHGGHLLEYWQVARNQSLFWPWYEQTDAAATEGEPHVEPEIVHVRTLALLKSAAVLPAAARELFAYPLVGTLQQMQAGLLLAAAPSDPNRPHTENAANLTDTAYRELPEDITAQAALLTDYFDGVTNEQPN